MTLLKPKSQLHKTMLLLITKRQVTSVEIARAVRCAYSARLIQRSEAQGFNIIHTMVPYTTRDKAKTRIACYTLGTTIKKATEIYNKMIGCTA